MEQVRLLRLAKYGLAQKIMKEKEIAERFKARRGFESRIQKIRIEKLWKEYDEITEMLIELEK